MVRRWVLLVRLIQRVFEYRVFPEELTWEIMVLLPKGKADYQ